MSYVTISRHAEISPDEAFDYAVKVDRLPQWLALLTRIVSGDERLDEVGASFSAELKLGGRHMDTSWEVTKVRAPNVVHLDGRSEDGSEATVYFSLSRWEAGCELEFEIDYELSGGFLAQVADRLFVHRAISRDLRHSLDSLVEILEEHPEVL